MMQREFKGLLVSDFTVDNLTGFLANAPGIPSTSARVAPFGQVTQVLLDATLSCWQPTPDFVVVWTRPQGVVKSFGELLMGRPIDLGTILAEVDRFADGILGTAGRSPFVFVPTWTMPMEERGLGPLDLKHPFGVARALAHMNLRLSERLSGSSHVFVLNADKWVQAAGKTAFNPKLWYLAKVPFSNEVFSGAALDLKAALGSVAGISRKLLVVDLDDTMWGGIVGDVGWENLRLGGHDPIGEALVEFQRCLKVLSSRGILLAIISKNDESVAVEAIQKHSEMVLSLKDFAGWRINWQDKATNLAELAQELNLGLQSVVFVDDNPAERARVRDSFPEVLVVDLPLDKTLYPAAIKGLRCFDSLALSEEDLRRTELYSAEQQRKTSLKEFQSMEDWLAGLRLVVEFAPLGQDTLSRTTQLLNKTNQLNLATRRLSESEVSKWASIPGNVLWSLRVEDKFGDYGITGIIGMQFDNVSGHAHLTDLVLSCRVMGRKVEEAMLHIAIEAARTRGCRAFHAVFLPTAKNKPCKEFLDRSGLIPDPKEVGRYSWDAQLPYTKPEFVQLKELTSASKGSPH